jgi:hypothetical protein
MSRDQARILVVDEPHGPTSLALGAALARDSVDFARDAFDAIDKIDCAVLPYDLIFCDLARGDLPGPELWAYLSLTHQEAARRMVFVASCPLKPETLAFLATVSNVCVDLPLDAEALASLDIRRPLAATG